MGERSGRGIKKTEGQVQEGGRARRAWEDINIGKGRKIRSQSKEKYQTFKRKFRKGGEMTLEGECGQTFQRGVAKRGVQGGGKPRRRWERKKGMMLR